MSETKRLPSVEKPWKKYFLEEDWNASVPEETIYQAFMRGSTGFEGNKAINFFDKVITYGEIHEHIEETVKSFRALGIKAGDTVPVCSGTLPEVTYCLYALSKIGATMLTLDPRRSGKEILEFVEASGSDVFVCIDLAYDAVKDGLDELGIGKVVIIKVENNMPFIIRHAKQLKMPAPKIEYTDKTVNWKTFISYGVDTETCEPAPFSKDHAAAITLTGGTTGRPKGVMITDLGFSALLQDFGACQVKYTREQRYLNIVPCFSSYGLVSSLHMPLVFGAEVIMIPKFEPDKVGHLIKKYKPNHTMLVPTHYEKLMNSKEAKKGLRLDFMYTCGSGGDTINAGLEEKLNDFLLSRGAKYPISQGYGMSEVSSAASCGCRNNVKSLSVGYPLLSTVVSVFKPGTTEELSYNEEGELCMSGPALMKGYFADPEETARTMRTHPDGTVWVHSGDIGYMDEDGFIFIKGRIKRMITRFDGHKVFPVGTEGQLGTVKNVEAVAVVGVNDNDHLQGQLPLAVVKLEDPTKKEETVAALWKLIDEEIEERGRPCDVVVIDEMPMTGMDKIDYKKLASDYDLNHNQRVVHA